jgi:hypothetical protein
MITTRQIERLWTNRRYGRLTDDLLGNRWEAAYRHKLTGSPALLAAAISMIRLYELDQSGAPVFGNLLRTILAAQESDGGWGDLAVTALCLRALMLDGGAGPAVARGIAYLAGLQQPEGSWPAIPFRRLPADPFMTAFIAAELGESADFRSRTRWTDTTDWLAAACELEESRGMWERIRLRSRQAKADDRAGRAGDGIRTHDVSLGKAAFYH